VTNQETRRRLLISRHIAKMTPEEIARRFTVSYTVSIGGVKQPRARTRAMQRLKAPD
jgi:transposase